MKVGEIWFKNTIPEMLVQLMKYDNTIDAYELNYICDFDALTDGTGKWCWIPRTELMQEFTKYE